MKILVLNCGSSSVKYQLVDTETNKALARGTVSRIGMSQSLLLHKPFDYPEVKITKEILDHIVAIENVINLLLSPENGVIKDKSEISAVGHRVVHGGERFSESALITAEVMEMIKECIDIAPLHNPHNIRGINACERILPKIPQVAVFDTAFHQRMPRVAYVYGIPYILYKKYGIRRYGFHGTSHFFVSRRAAELLGKSLLQLKIITCHLGNGASMAAVREGISVDTTMGFTPLEGLLMGTRSGDLDPSIILHVMAREELTLHEANTLLNKHSGMQGISGISSDMKDIIEDCEKGNPSAQLALDVYCYRIKKYIGAYTASMGGLDALVFTAGIGENSPLVREKSCEELKTFGIEIDDQKNEETVGIEGEISSNDSRVKVFAIPTNEELVIASDTRRIVEEAQSSKIMHKGL